MMMMMEEMATDASYVSVCDNIHVRASSTVK